MDERSFQLGVALIIVGVVCFSFGHLQGKGAGQLEHAAHGGEVVDDSHYAFVPGGTNGTVEVIGLPSGQRLTSIPVLSAHSGRGYATAGSDADKALAASGGHGGDLVRLVSSQGAHGASAKGRQLFAVDRANNRVARIELRGFSTKAISSVIPGLHGAGDALHKPGPGVGTLIVTGEFSNYVAVLDAGSLAVNVMIKLPGNAARCAAVGKWLLVTSYDGIGPDDSLLAINMEACAKQAKETQIDGQTVACVDLTADGAKGSLYRNVPVCPGAAGVTVTADGKHALVSCREEGNVSVVEIAVLDKVKNARDAVVAEPIIGAGALTTVVSRDGTAYTLCFERSELVRWSVSEVLAGKVRYVKGRSTVRYHPTDLSAAIDSASGETEYLLVQGASALDQFLPVAGAAPGSLTLVGINHGAASPIASWPIDAPTRGAVIVAQAVIAPHLRSTENATHPAAGLQRKGNQVTVNIVLSRGSVEPAEVALLPGDRVQLVVHNLDKIPGYRQGLVIGGHGVSVDVPPGGSRSATFEVGGEGTFWYYTTRQTANGSATARGRMIVNAKAK